MHDEYESQAITVEAALKHILSCTKVLLDTEQVKIEQSLHKVCAEDGIAKINVPAQLCAAMDGYATIAGYCTKIPCELQIIGESLSGKPYQGRDIKTGECIKVMTGAVLPNTVDTVIMAEQTEEKNGHVNIKQKIDSGQYLRKAGEDIKADDIAIEKGKRISAADMAFLYACGIDTIRVYKRPRVNFFNTGDELKRIGDILDIGDIYSSNSLSLLGMLSEAHCEVKNLGIVKDNQDALDQALTTAQENSDCVISTGSASIDAAPHIKDILAKQGTTDFYRIAMKPGRPFIFGKLENKMPFFGLPGNPVSVMATFYLLVLPALRRMSGEKNVMPQRMQAICTDKIHKHAGRSDYQRGTLYNDTHNNNKLSVALVGEQKSHLLSGMSQANCFIELSRDAKEQKAGTLVTVIPFSGLL